MMVARILFFALLLSLPFRTTLSAQTAQLAATLSSSPVPPGGTAQLILTIPSPLTLVHGRFTIDLDATVFDNIAAVNVFSATGDQIGVANLQGRHADVEFTSNTGGVGRLPSLPVLELTVPVLSTAKAGTLSTPALKSSDVWRDFSGSAYMLAFHVNPVSIGGSLSIQSVVSAGTAVTVNGTGFTPSSSLHLDSVAWSNLQFVNSTQLMFSLATETELTGRLITIQNPDGAQTVYYSAVTIQNVSHAGRRTPPAVQPIFPLTAYPGASLGLNKTSFVALENASGIPVAVTLTEESYQPYGPHGAVSQSFEIDVTIPPRAVYIRDLQELFETNYVYNVFFRAVPSVRGVVLDASLPAVHPGAAASGLAYFPDLASGPPFTIDVIPEDQNGLNSHWNWQRGTPFPQSRAFDILFGNMVTYSANAVTDDGNPWLLVSPASGPTCSSTRCPDSTSVITVSVGPSNLASGIHNGIVNISSNDPNVASAHLHVTLNVSDSPFISNGTVSILSFEDLFPNAPAPVSIAITSSGAPVPITVSASTGASPSWLAVTPENATTPATVTVSVMNHPNLANQSYNPGGTIIVQGPANTLAIPVILYLSAYDFNTNPLAFSIAAGAATKVTQSVEVYQLTQPLILSISTTSGGPWLTAILVTPPGGVPAVSVSADPTGLASGAYQGTITVTSTAPQSGPETSVQIPVSLTVYNSAVPALAASLTNLSFTALSGSSASSQLITVSTGSLPLPLAFDLVTDDGGNWLSASLPGLSGIIPVTPAGLSISANPQTLFPGVYHGHVTVNSPPGSGSQVTVAVTLTVTPASPISGPPLMASLVNAASQLTGPLAPGEIVTLFGLNLGPLNPSGVHVGSNGLVNTSALGTRLLFNGVPAPLLYSSPTQMNAAVPYEVAGSASVSVQLDANGTLTPAWGIPTAASEPGIFAILNEDGTLNSSANPAAPGSIIQIFATGEGQTTVPGITGEITGSNTKQSALPAGVWIAGNAASVTSASTAPNSVAGLFQIDARVPPATPTGANAAVIHIGLSSSPVATMFVK